MKTDFEQLDGYSRNLLGKDATSEFKLLLAQDENLKSELDLHLMVNELAKDFGYLDLEKTIQTDLAKWRAEDQRKKIFNGAAIISIITASILGLLYVWLNFKTDPVNEIKNTTNNSLVQTYKIQEQKLVVSKTETMDLKKIEKTVSKTTVIKKVNKESSTSQPIPSSQNINYDKLEVPMSTITSENTKSISVTHKEIDSKPAHIEEKQVTKPLATNSVEMAEPVKKLAKKEYVIQPGLGEVFVPEMEEHQSGWLSIKNKSGMEVFKIHFVNKETAKWEPQNGTDIGQYLFEIRFDDGASQYGYISIIQ